MSIKATFTRVVTLTVGKLVAFLAAAAVLGFAFGSIPSAHAADVVGAGHRQETVIATGTVSATANYSNATTSATDIAGATVTIPSTNKSIYRQFYRACYFADAGKATSTTGTIGLTVNGVAVAEAARQISSAAVRGSVVTCYVAPRPVNTSFVVKLTGVSADTAAFTVYNAQLNVEVFYAPA